MKKGESVYCINEALYADHITKRKRYFIKDVKTDQFRILNNNNKLVWIPSYCFTNYKAPEIISINIDDEINDKYNSCIEVTIKFDDGSKRWAIFMTINHLNNLFNEYRDYVTGNRLILTKEINENMIKKAIHELDKQNELYENTNKY
ncbi:hypothetical protein [Tenacibaculum jejuense]|uniref:Uncharacterized protein n=1 Tax=Tenacibaculum jejuense TaxID=584609 RepID=A0A238U5I9_9FLAO|nr:hypothetical protein [Tenacibaculum jejuense]SNR14479.1 conserved protein of unknown function [Tenacibaculum jejuense]